MRQSADEIKVGNVWTWLTNPDSKVWDQIKVLEEPLDGGPGLRSKPGDAFFTGLLSMLSEANSFIISDDDKLQDPIDKYLAIPDFVNREYQREAVRAARRFKRGVINMPTGSGKTRVTAGIMGSIPCRWLYLVHRASLVESAAQQISELLGEKVGRVNPRDYADCRILCSTFDEIASDTDSVFKRFVLENVHGVVVDECHKVPTATALGVLVQTRSAYYRIGLSATPFMREDKKDILTVALLGQEIYKVDAASLIKDQYIVAPRIHWISCMQYSSSNRWNRVYQDLIVNSEKRNSKLIDAIVTTPKPAIVFVKEVQHGTNLIASLQSLLGSHRVQWTWGSATLAERMTVIDALNKGNKDVLICTNIFSEGMDVPKIKSVFNCTGESSWKESIQRLGRGDRKSDGKDSFILYDVADMGNKWLTEHTTQRYLAYRAAGFDVEPPTAAAYFRQFTTAKRDEPTLNKATRMAPAKRGALILLGILAPIFVLMYWVLNKMATK